MKKLFVILFIACVWPMLTAQQAAQQMACRILGRKAAAHFVFECLPDSTDNFTLYTRGKKTVITANNDISMAMGLNYYLKHYAKVHVSWYVPQQPIVVSSWPVVPQPVSRKAVVSIRFFLNYCTYGYTMPWWQWKQWEHFIDWMALNGINMPLALTGQEAVWYEVWKDFGLTDEEIRNYFSGPAHLPWHRMANLDGFGGPLPMSWIQDQQVLQQRILVREREWGMKPVLPAFAGHVPAKIKDMFPQANIQPLSSWCGFAPTCFLHAEDSLFAVIQQKYLQLQTQMYGTDHVYSIDPFNEMDPPCWQPEYLANVSKNIYNSLLQVDEQAQWLQMSWVFYYKCKQWTPQRLKAYLTAVPQNKMLLLDYFCEKTEVWRTTIDSYMGSTDGKKYGFYGQPYVWCYLGNFGGNTMLVGNINALEQKLQSALHQAGSNLQGVGSTLESFDCSPQIYEYLFEKVWNPSLSAENWVNDWAEMRLGATSNRVKMMWNMLHNGVYTDNAFYGLGTQMVARPTFYGHGTYYTKPYYTYNNDILLAVCRSMTIYGTHWKHLPPSYSYDIINLLSQWLGNHFMEVRNRFTIAYNMQDTLGMQEQIAVANALFHDADTLLGCNTDFMLGAWIAQARACGHTPAEQEYYEQQARTLLTVWGGPVLNDYANRMWNGLIKYYYAERWNMFFNAALQAVCRHDTLSEDEFSRNLSVWEQTWNTTHQSIPAKAQGDAIQVAMYVLQHVDSLYMKDKYMLIKYREQFPESTLKDIYKTCFQDYYGPSHIVNDTSTIAAGIMEEINNADTMGGPDYCYTGVNGNYVCVNLLAVRQHRLPLATLVSALQRSMHTAHSPSLKYWQCLWQQLLPVAKQLLPPTPLVEADSTYIVQQLQQGKVTGRHSELFNHSYHFYYRIIQRQLFETEILPLLENKDTKNNK